MRKFLSTKNHLRALSTFLVCCLIAGMVGTYPLLALGNGTSQYKTVGAPLSIEQVEDGEKIIYAAGVKSYMRACTKDDVSYNAAQGIHLEVKDITSPEDEYSFVVAFGDSNNQWTDKAGYMLVYGNKGHFEIFPTKNKNISSVAGGSEIVEVEREPLGDALTMDLKLEGDNYVITINGDTYTIPAVNPDGEKANSGNNWQGSALSDTKNLHFGFGFQGGIDPKTVDVKYTQWPWEPVGASEGSSFVLAELSNNYQTPEIDNTEIGTLGSAMTLDALNYTKDDEANGTTGYAEPQQIDGAGVKFSHKENTSESAHVNTVEAYNTVKGVLLNINGISAESAEEDYAVALAIGKNGAQWSDKEGYMLTYAKSGAFSIIKTADGNTLKGGKKLVSIKREALGDEFTVYLQKQSGDKDYILTVNGQSYTIHDADDSILVAEGDDKDKVYFGMGIIKGGSDAAFTVNKITDEKFVPQETGGYWPTANVALTKNGENVTANYVNDPVVCNEQIYTAKSYDANNGIHVEIPVISVPEGTDYSFAVSIGNDCKQWYNKAGYMLVYGKDGLFGIFTAKDGNQTPVDTGNALVTLKREELRTKLTLDLKQENNDFVLTVNGNTYYIPALEDSNLYFGFGLLGGVEVTTASNGKISWKGVAWSNFKLGEGASFTISQISDKYHAPVIAKADTDESAGEYDGEKVTFGNGAFKRFNPKNAYSTRTGVHLEVSGIYASDDDYSFALSIGNSENVDGDSNQWHDRRGYMVFYDTEGNFSVHAIGKEGGFDIGETLISLKREPLIDMVSVDLKQKGDNFMLTVNSKSYTIPANHDAYPMGNVDQVRLGMSVYDGGIVGTSDFKVDKAFTESGFTIDRLYSASEPDRTTPPDWLGGGSGFEFEKTEAGVIVTHLAKTSASARFSVKAAYLLDGEGVTLDIKGISSKSSNYSLVVGMGGNNHIWYDKKGTFVLYGKSGNTAIIGTSGKPNVTGGVENPNDAKMLAWANAEQSDSFLMNIRQKDDGYYVITINDREYVIDGEYLDYSDQVYIQIGVMSDFNLNNGDMTDLKYWEDGFKNEKVSFTIAGFTGVKAGDEPIEGTPAEPDDFGMYTVGANVKLYGTEKGVMVVHEATAYAWERAVYRNKFSTQGDGIHLKLTDITSKAKNYSMAVFVGSGGWFDANGYMILYDKKGNFSIVATDAELKNVNTSPLLVSEVREALGDTLTVDVKLKGTNYNITVNGKTYTVPAQCESCSVSNTRELTLAMGVMGGGKADSLEFLENNFKHNYVSFVIAEATGLIDKELGKEFNMHATGNSWQMEKTNKGIKVTHGVAGTGTERVSLNDTYAATEGGIQIELTDIASQDPNYSMAVMLGNVSDPWYDCTGYMLIYGKSGNFSIIATAASLINPNRSPVLVSEVREALGEKLSVNVRLSRDNYKITVNGKTYTIPAEHEEYALKDVENLYLSFGVMSDGKVGELIYDKEFKSSKLSFTIASVYHSDENVADEDPEEEPDVKPEEKPDKKPDKKPSEEPEEEKTINAILIGCMAGAAFILVAAIVVIIIVAKKKKERAGEEA